MQMYSRIELHKVVADIILSPTLPAFQAKDAVIIFLLLFYCLSVLEAFF